MIVVTMYNEGHSLLANTLEGIQKNIEHFEAIGVSRHRIGVVVVCDGSAKIDKTVQEFGKIPD